MRWYMTQLSKHDCQGWFNKSQAEAALTSGAELWSRLCSLQTQQHRDGQEPTSLTHHFNRPCYLLLK